MRDFFCLSVGNSRSPTFQRQLRIKQAKVQWCFLSYLVSLFVFFWAFSLRFGILRYEWLFRFCNGLKTRVNSMYQSKEPIYILHYFISFCRNQSFFLETKNRIRKSDEKSAGSMREFREKGAGMPDEHSHPPFRPELFQRKQLLPYTCA